MDWHIAAFTTAFIAMDIASGFIQAIANKELDSSKMRSGLWHKCGFMLTIILAALVEWAMDFIDLGFTLPLFTPVCVFICLTEVVSVLENLVLLTPELGNTKLMKIFGKDIDGD